MIKELECEYRNGKAKSEMFQELFEAEKSLQHYKFLLEDELCKEIVIRKDGIYGTFNILGKELSMYLDDTDLCAVPSQLINKGFYENEELEMVIQILNLLPKNSTFFEWRPPRPHNYTSDAILRPQHLYHASCLHLSGKCSLSCMVLNKLFFLFV